MPISAIKITEWVEKELPPLSWGVLSMKLMRSFMAAGISPRNITSETQFHDELVAELRQLIRENYKKDMPI